MQDAHLMVCSAHDIGAATEPVVSEDWIDLQAARDLGVGTELCFVVTFSESVGFATTTSSMSIQAILSDEAAFTSNFDIAGEKSGLVETDLVANDGYVVVKINPDVIERAANVPHTGDAAAETGLGRRYLGLRFVTNDGANLTAGICDAYLTTVADLGAKGKKYPIGYSVK